MSNPKTYRPTAVAMMTVSRVLADSNIPLNNKSIRDWFPDTECIFSDHDHDFMTRWYRLYSLKSVATYREPKGKKFRKWRKKWE